MSAASAKRPASSAKGHTGRGPAKRPVKAAVRPRSLRADPPATPEPLDGPGYQFAGFRMMCRHRHIRH